ncbi:hypothetical protein LR69_00612 [Geobacillus sp. BCO2]|nr:hypothetical protein LR69_00612 [Geobacillus sp. BCO2]
MYPYGEVSLNSRCTGADGLGEKADGQQSNTAGIDGYNNRHNSEAPLPRRKTHSIHQMKRMTKTCGQETFLL